MSIDCASTDRKTRSLSHGMARFKLVRKRESLDRRRGVPDWRYSSAPRRWPTSRPARRSQYRTENGRRPPRIRRALTEHRRYSRLSRTESMSAAARGGARNVRLFRGSPKDARRRPCRGLSRNVKRWKDADGIVVERFTSKREYRALGRLNVTGGCPQGSASIRCVTVARIADGGPSCSPRQITRPGASLNVVFHPLAVRSTTTSLKGAAKSLNTPRMIRSTSCRSIRSNSLATTKRRRMKTPVTFSGRSECFQQNCVHGPAQCVIVAKRSSSWDLASRPREYGHLTAVVPHRHTGCTRK